MKEQWIKDMQDRFADFEQPAPEGLLDDIQREMEHRGLVPVEKASDTQRRLIPLWMRRAAAAAIVAVAIGTGTLLLMNDDDLPKPVAQEQTIETQTLPTYIDEPQNEIAEAKALTPEPKQMMRNRQISELLATAPTVAKEDLMAETFLDTATETGHTDAVLSPAVIENEVQETKQEELSQESDVDYSTTVSAVTPSPTAASTNTYQPKRSKSGNKRWEVGASVAGMQGLGNPNYSFYLYGNSLLRSSMKFINSVLNSSKVSPGYITHPDYDHGAISSAGDVQPDDPYYIHPLNPSYNNPTTSVEIHNTGSYMVSINQHLYSMVVDTHHRQPVKVGLSMRYHFNDRWSLQTGIDYSYHSSDLVLQIEKMQIQSEQKLHFVGVPVNLAYTLWSLGRFNVYLSGGGEIEKVIKGMQSTIGMTSDITDKKELQDVEEKPWQISISGSAGVQFSVTKLLSIYAEPGVAYYFDNKSSLPTIYQEKPFNFNLNLGLRFNLGK